MFSQLCYFQLQIEDRSETALLAKRLPKYKSLMSQCAIVPATGCFTANIEQSMDQLLYHLLPDGRETLNKASAILSFASDQEDYDLAIKLSHLLEAVGISTVCTRLSATWHTQCLESQVCIPILSGRYMKSIRVEGQLSWAKDSGMQIVAIAGDRDGYDALMRSL